MTVRRIAIAPLALILAISTPAFGQHQGGGTQGHPPQSGKQSAAPQQQRAQPPATPRTQTRQNTQQQQVQQTQRQTTTTAQRRDNPAIKTYRGQDSYRVGAPPPVAQQRYDAQRDRSVYRHTYRAEQRYRIRPYVRPRGWYLYNWTLGEILPSLFWTRSYWIVSYWLYGLPIPPVGCIWVRYDHDALLIDQRTGEVIEVIYDIFY